MTPAFHLLRVFTWPGHEGGGNPAPVCLDADGLSTDAMQAIARDSGHESVCVLRPRDAAHDLHMRFFVPRQEVEMCGHATLGALWLLHRLGRWHGEPLRIGTASGTVQARRADGAVEISQPRGTAAPLSAAEVADIAACLGIAPAQIAGPVLNAATSRIKTLIPLADPAVLHSLPVRWQNVEALCTRIGSTGLYPYAAWPGQPGTGTSTVAGTNTVSARQFPRASGYPEDAATGIAATALAWGLRTLGQLADGEQLLTVHQGEAMGAPSRIEVRLPPQAQADEGCWLRGEATLHAATAAPASTAEPLS